MFLSSVSRVRARFLGIQQSRISNPQQENVAAPQVSHRPKPEVLQDAIETSASFVPPTIPTANTVWVASKKQAQPTVRTLRELPGNYVHWIERFRKSRRTIRNLKARAKNLAHEGAYVKWHGDNRGFDATKEPAPINFYGLGGPMSVGQRKHYSSRIMNGNSKRILHRVSK